MAQTPTAVNSTHYRPHKQVIDKMTCAEFSLQRTIGDFTRARAEAELTNDRTTAVFCAGVLSFLEIIKRGTGEAIDRVARPPMVGVVPETGDTLAALGMVGIAAVSDSERVSVAASVDGGDA